MTTDDPLEDGACVGKPAHWWFPTANGGTYDRARRVCVTCPVQAPCLAQALRDEAGSLCNRYGMWGGLTPPERERLSKGLPVFIGRGSKARAS